MDNPVLKAAFRAGLTLFSPGKTGQGPHSLGSLLQESGLFEPAFLQKKQTRK
jgi:hypothetical protein